VRTKVWLRRLAVTLLGVLFALVVLELSLRAAGGLFTGRQRIRNVEAMEPLGGHVILCVGESTTAMGGDDSYPSQLQDVLDERAGDGRFTVINEGIPGTDTSVIVSQLANNLDRYGAEVVVAMMGANDVPDGAIPKLDVPAADRTGPLGSLRTVKLARQLLFEVDKDRTRKAGGSGPGAGPPGHDRGRPGSHPQYEAGVNEARMLVDAYRYAEAEEALLQAVELDPGRLPAYVQLGHLYETLARYEEAEEALMAGVQTCPRCPDPLIELARHYERREEAEPAMEHFRQAISMQPDDTRAWFGLGRMLRKEERFAEAAEAFERVVALEPDDPRAYVSLGLCLEPLGELDRAEVALHKGWSMDLGDRRAFIRLADFLERQGRHTEMEQLVAEAVTDDADDDILGRIARYYSRQGDAEQADRYLRLADDARRRHTPPMTRENYLTSRRIVDARGVHLVAVQYPVRDIDPLTAIFAGTEGVHFVDNGNPFREALARMPYDRLFWDNCYGDFGHCTREGNRLLAENVADVILGEIYAAP